MSIAKSIMMNNSPDNLTKIVETLENPNITLENKNSDEKKISIKEKVKTNLLSKAYTVSEFLYLYDDKDYQNKLQVKTAEKIYSGVQTSLKVINKLNPVNLWKTKLERTIEELEIAKKYLLEVNLTKKYDPIKEEAKKDAFKELSKPEYGIKNEWLRTKLSNMARIPKEKLPPELRDARNVHHKLAAYAFALSVGGEIFQKQLETISKITRTPRDELIKADIYLSYPMSFLTAGLQLGPSIQIATGRPYWQSFQDALSIKLLETASRHIIYRKSGNYTISPSKAVTLSTIPVVATTGAIEFARQLSLNTDLQIILTQIDQKLEPITNKITKLKDKTTQYTNKGIENLANNLNFNNIIKNINNSNMYSQQRIYSFGPAYVITPLNFQGK